jgi:hypothetical protein
VKAMAKLFALGAATTGALVLSARVGQAQLVITGNDEKVRFGPSPAPGWRGLCPGAGRARPPPLRIRGIGPDKEAPRRPDRMRSVRVRIRAAEFSAMMTAIDDWLGANRYEPTRYKYAHYEDTVLVTLDFAAEVPAEAFTVRFDGIYKLPRATSPNSSHQSPT